MDPYLKQEYLKIKTTNDKCFNPCFNGSISQTFFIFIEIEI